MSLLVIALMVLSVLLWALERAQAANLKCWATWNQQNNGASGRVYLAPASYDKDFLAADLLQFGLGVDTYNFAQKTLIFVIVDHQTHRSTTVTAGLRPVPGSAVEMAEVIWLEPLADGSKLQIALDCVSQ